MTFGLAQLHENERLLAWVQTSPGRLTLWTTAMVMLAWHTSSPLLLGAFTAVTLSPYRRRLFLSIAAVGVIADLFIVLPESSDIKASLLQWPLAAVSAVSVENCLTIVAGLGCLYLAFIVARNTQRWPAIVLRHPILTLHASVWIALALSTLPWLGAFAMVPFLAWRLSYLADSAARDKVIGTRFSDHLFYLVPVYGGSKTPYAKGLDYLSRHEARDPQAIARSQLAGIKLLVLAILWSYSYKALDAVVFAGPVAGLPDWLTIWPAGWSLDWPRLSVLLQADAPLDWYVGWLAIYLELIRSTLILAAAGHVTVGSLRLFGFNVFRNTYKPLLSQSVLEFWNRYHHYFKELLVDFFFYPTYLRLRRLSPAARMFVAVFAAAFVGNIYFHILADPDLVLQLDAAGLWAQWSPRLVYCFLLASGIWISMLRQSKQRASGVDAGFWQTVRRIAGVWTFYAIIRIWNVRLDGVGIGECFAFFLGLFGI